MVFLIGSGPLSSRLSFESWKKWIAFLESAPKSASKNLGVLLHAEKSHFCPPPLCNVVMKYHNNIYFVGYGVHMALTPSTPRRGGGSKRRRRRRRRRRPKYICLVVSSEARIFPFIFSCG